MLDFVEKLLADPLAHVPIATVACFDPTCGELPRRKLDEIRTQMFLEKLAAASAPAVLIAASTGGGHLRTVDELSEWFAVAADARLGGTVKSALLRPEDGEACNARLIEQLRELQFPLVYVRPGNNLSPTATDDEVAANLQPLVSRLARNGLAVGLYSIPDVSGLPMSAEAAAQVVQGEGGQNVVAIKVTEADYASSTRSFLQHPQLRRLKIVQGWDPHLAQALQDGPVYDANGRQRCGVTSGPMSFALYQYLHMLQAAEQNDWPEVQQAQAAVTALFAAMQDDPRKFADLQRAKYIMGLGQPLLGTVSTAQVDRVFAALESLPRIADRQRLARSLDLMQEGPFHERLLQLANE